MFSHLHQRTERDHFEGLAYECSLEICLEDAFLAVKGYLSTLPQLRDEARNLECRW